MAVPVVEKGYVRGKAAPWWRTTDEDETTPELVWPRSVLVYDQMRRQDAQIKSVLRAVELPLRRARWWVDPAGAELEVARFVADNLGLPLKGEEPTATRRTRDRFSWSEHLRLALTMLPFGHSFFEQVYRIEGGKAWLRKLGWRPPRTISQINVAADGGLESIEQHGLGTAKTAKIPVSQLVAYVCDREGGNWLGQSLLRPAYKNWLLKDQALRIQAQVIERNGLGIPVYEGADQPEVGSAEDKLKRAEDDLAAGAELARMWRSGDNAGAAVPHGAKLTLQGVNGTLPKADPWIRYLDEQIARAVLANFLQLGGENSTGSYALGETFADFFILSLQTVATSIKDVTDQHVIEDLVDINFGADAAAPQLGFEEIGSRGHLSPEAIRALVECGVLTADEPLEAYTRDRGGLPAADSKTRRERTNASPPAPTDGASE